MSDLKLVANKNKVKNSISFKMTEDDDPNEIALLYFSFGYLRQSLEASQKHLMPQEQKNIASYMEILDRWISDLKPSIKESDVFGVPIITR